MKKILVVIALMLSFLVGNVADKYNSLGTESYKNGNYNKALDIRKEVLGEKHVDTALSYNNIGVIYISLGDYNKALDIQKQVLGEKHEDTARSYNNISSITGIGATIK